MKHGDTQLVEGSIPKGVTGIFPWFNPSGDTTTLRSTQPLTENKYQGYFLGGKGGRCVGLTTLPASCADYLEILRASTYWSPNDLSRSILGQLKKCCEGDMLLKNTDYEPRITHLIKKINANTVYHISRVKLLVTTLFRVSWASSVFINFKWQSNMVTWYTANSIPDSVVRRIKFY